MIPVFFALLVQAQQPGRPPATQATPPVRTQAAQVHASSREMHTPYDTTVAAIRRVAVSVAEVKSGLEVFRRAAAREQSAIVVERASALEGKCQAMARVVVEEARRMCRTCVSGERLTALERYRTYLASVARVGTQCARTLGAERRDRTVDQAAAGLKRQRRTLSDRIVAGLVPYEQRLAAVRQTFGWAPTQTPASR